MELKEEEDKNIQYQSYKTGKCEQQEESSEKNNQSMFLIFSGVMVDDYCKGSTILTFVNS